MFIIVWIKCFFRLHAFNLDCIKRSKWMEGYVGEGEDSLVRKFGFSMKTFFGPNFSVPPIWTDTWQVSVNDEFDSSICVFINYLTLSSSSQIMVPCRILSAKVFQMAHEILCKHFWHVLCWKCHISLYWEFDLSLETGWSLELHGLLFTDLECHWLVPLEY